MSQRSVLVLGAGPIGLAAASHLLDQGADVTILEQGARAGANITEWGHVRLFSPWRSLVDQVSAKRLAQSGWDLPDPEALPTGHELVAQYIQPLAHTFADRLRTRHRVVSVSRDGLDKVRTQRRAERPFVARVETPTGALDVRAAAVLDATGTWQNPSPAGANGLFADGEDAAPIAYGIPDILGADRDTYAGRRVAVIGAGHTAANALLDLFALTAHHPATSLVWLIRRDTAARALGPADDVLEGRSALGARVAELVDRGAIELITSFSTDRFERHAVGWTACGRTCDRAVRADRFIVATGQRPDLTMTRELQLALDPTLESPIGLAPLIDPDVHTCNTVRPHGERELAHPEPGFYTIGMKSYGRAPTFLLSTGYDQVRSVVTAICADRATFPAIDGGVPRAAGYGASAADAAAS